MSTTSVNEATEFYMKTALKIHKQVDQFKEVARQRNELLAACKAIFRAIENNELVRDISRDHEPDWALRMLQLAKDLAAMHQAIDRAEGKEVA